MSPQQLDAIEARLGFPLPQEYRRISTERPFRPIRGDHIYWFFDEPGQVIGETLHPQADGEHEGLCLPAGWLAIGFDACGDTYVLDTRAESLPVHCLSHETHRIEPEYPSFAAFVADWLGAPERIESEARAREATAVAERRAMMRRARRMILLGSLIVVVVPLLALTVLVWSNERRRRRASPERH